MVRPSRIVLALVAVIILLFGAVVTPAAASAPAGAARFALQLSAQDTGRAASAPNPRKPLTPAEIRSLQPGQYEAGSVIVKFRATVDEATALSTEQRHGLRVKRQAAPHDPHAVALPSSLSVADAVEQLSSDPSVEYVEPNYILHVIDPDGVHAPRLSGEQDAGDGAGVTQALSSAAGPGTVNALMAVNDPRLPDQWGHAKIQLLQAWNLTMGNAAIIVAVIDSGIDYHHPDIPANVILGPDLVNNDNDPMDDDGHGTATGGLIGALTNNGVGIAGTAPNTKLLVIKALDNTGSGTAQDVANAIEYAADHGARVVNLSVGGPFYSATLDEAVQYATGKGVLVVAAAGNDGAPLLSYPAALPNVLAVGASRPSDQRSPFSNYGFGLDLLAPGEHVLSTVPSFYGDKSGYAFLSGTSFAAPYTSGVAALVLALKPTLSPADLATVLETTADDLGATGWDSETGYGRLNAFRAVSAVAQLTVVKSGASYNAIGAAGEKAYLPFVPRNWNSWTATVVVQNTGASASGANLSFFDQNGTMVGSYAVPSLAAGGSTQIVLTSVTGLPDGFTGSGVLQGSAGSSFAAIVNLDKNGMDRAAYEGLVAGSAPLYAPLLFKSYNGWNTTLQVQNLGTVAAPVTITYRHRDTGQTWSESFTVPPSSPKLLSQASSPLLPDGFVGSAVLTTANGQPLGLVVHEEKATYAMAYTGMSGGSTTISAPLLFKAYNGYDSGWQIQNLGNQATTVTLRYTRTDGTTGAWTASATVEAGASASFQQSKDAQLPDGAVLSAIATSSNGQPLAGLVNELKYNESQTLTYDSFGGGSMAVAAPYMLKGVNNWRTGIQIQDLGLGAAQVLVRFLNTDGTVLYTISDSIPVGAARPYDLQNITQVPTGWTGSAIAMSTNGQPIAAIVNEVRQ